MTKPTRKQRSDSVTGKIQAAQRKPAMWPVPDLIDLNPEQTKIFLELTAVRDEWDKFSLRLLATAAQLLHDRQALYQAGMQEPVVLLTNGAKAVNPSLKLATDMQNQVCQIFMRLGIKERAILSGADSDKHHIKNDKIMSLLAI